MGTALSMAAMLGPQTFAQGRPPDTSARAVVNKAAAFVKGYQEALKFVIADEATVQEVFDTDGNRVARRETSGDFFLAYVPADGGWLAVRDIVTVDGVPVQQRDNLRLLLSRGSFARIGRQIANRNARFNIGAIDRNFNDPMLALVILGDKNRDRFRFSRRTVEQTPDGPVVSVAFTERDRPTLVRGSDGSDIFATGEMTIEATTGRLRQTTITLKNDDTQASVTTVFVEHEILKLWLPRFLTERYEHTTSRLRELVVAESTYTNYRRFDVNVIIK
ncbi:MAG: hypothetical protein HQ485_12625 [Acidobacteria bacterium]|nr:hypothetical protein [Acidobacteriota bacterium]